MMHRLKLHRIDEDGQEFLYLDLEHRQSEDDRWVLYGFVAQSSDLTFLLSVTPSNGKPGEAEEMGVPDLETGINTLLAMYHARINTQ